MKFFKSTSDAIDLASEADLARDRHDWPLAAELYDAALRNNPGRADIWVQYGHALKESKRLDAAIVAYRKALELDPASSDAHLQLGHALKISGDSAGARAAYREALALDRDNAAAAQELGLPVARAPDRQLAATAEYVFDVSDLMQYFENARLPTGIQRVQIEVITRLLADLARVPSVDVIAFDVADTGWKQISEAAFVQLCMLALAAGDRDDPFWLLARKSITSKLQTAPNYRFREGAALINLGTSWWLQNYFMHVRQAKVRYGIRYIPFVHDCIPVITPENCIKELTQDFIGWLIGVFAHADGYIANSQSTALDLKRVAALLGAELLPIEVVRLDGRFSSAATEDDLEAVADSEAVAAVVDTPFVLFVSTIEARKNHLLVLETWLDLCRKHGEDAVPDLVCVGNRGWLVESVFERHGASQILKQKVRFLHGISDSDLARLYKSCQFFVYPSNYEGWGLPVTEALSFGKPGIVANSSSLPEAGGEFVIYFEPGNRSDFFAAVEVFMFDTERLTAQANKVRRGFKPRSWEAIGEDIIKAARQHVAEPRKSLLARHRHIVPSRFYKLSRNYELRIWKGMIGNEVFRDELGWWGLDNFGCWMRKPQARLSFVPPMDGRGMVQLQLMGFPPGAPACEAELKIEGGIDRVVVPPSERRWIGLPLLMSAGQTITLTLVTRSLCKLSDYGAPDEKRSVTGGVCGFVVHYDEDEKSRLKFTEALVLNRLDWQEGKPPVLFG